MALFCNNHANLPIHKWHSITRKSSAKSLQGTPLISWRKGRCVKDIPVRPTPLLAIHVNQCTSFATQNPHAETATVQGKCNVLWIFVLRIQSAFRPPVGNPDTN